MKTYALIVQYDGTEYAGFQVQVGQRTVQGELEEALSRLGPSRIRVAGAGRTDAGVHSEGQTVSFKDDGTYSSHRAPALRAERTASP